MSSRAKFAKRTRPGTHLTTNAGIHGSRLSLRSAGMTAGARIDMNIHTQPLIRHEAMRIAGKRVETDQVVEVFNPYNGAVVGTVPAAWGEHVREAFAKAKAFKPKLTRYERQQILMKT